jgi:1-acyl-sn-glycerol-3-phosphate acyltransferase
MLSWFDNFFDRKLLTDLARGRVSREDLAFRLLPAFTLEIIRRYLRVESAGLENIPPTGPAIVISNHSGYAGFDAVMLANEIYRKTGRRARMVAHKLWFLGKPVQVLSEKMGLIEADLNSALEALRKGEIIILFPEGEAGNFKPSSRRYRLQEFKRGFVRLAMISKAPIIPAAVIGAEETHINVSQIKITKYLLGIVVPVPLNIIPLPVQWKIQLYPPIELDSRPSDALDREKVYRETRRIRHQLQREIIKELRRRGANFANVEKIEEIDLP